MSRRLKFQNFIEDGENKIIFYCEEYKSLFRSDRCGGTAELLYKIPIEGNSLYGKIYRYKDKVLCVPQCAADILIYNLNTKEEKFVRIEMDTWGNRHAEERGRFLSGILYGKYLFLIGYWSTWVLRLDIELEKITGCVNLSEALSIPVCNRTVCFKNAVLYHGKIMMPAYGANLIFMIDPESMEYWKKEIPDNKGGFSDIAVTSQGIFLSPKLEGKFLRLDDSMNIVKAIEDLPMDFKWGENANFTGLIEWKDSLYAVPYKASHIIEITQNGKQNKAIIEKEINRYFALLGTEREIMKYEFVQISNDELFIYCNESREVIVKRNREGFRTCSYFLPKELETEILLHGATNGGISEKQGELELFISGMQCYKENTDRLGKTDDIGKQIYEGLS